MALGLSEQIGRIRQPTLPASQLRESHKRVGEALTVDRSERAEVPHKLRLRVRPGAAPE